MIPPLPHFYIYSCSKPKKIYPFGPELLNECFSQQTACIKVSVIQFQFQKRRLFIGIAA